MDRYVIDERRRGGRLTFLVSVLVVAVIVIVVWPLIVSAGRQVRVKACEVERVGATVTTSPECQQ